jgi:non-ribosomal peptide synthetase component F
VIFTSGSTGTPKGVAVSHRAAAAFVDAEARLWTIGPDDRVLAGLSVAFDASCEEMWLAWRHGAALVPAPRELVRAGAEFGPWIAEHGITVISTVPTLAAMWDETALAGVRLLIFGGEAPPTELAWRLAATVKSGTPTVRPRPRSPPLRPACALASPSRSVGRLPVGRLPSSTMRESRLP